MIDTALERLQTTKRLFHQYTYLQCATKQMLLKEVVKKKGEDDSRNQSLVIEKNGVRLSFN